MKSCQKNLQIFTTAVVISSKTLEKTLEMFTTAVVISSGHLGQTSDKPAIVVIVREIGQLYLQKGKLMTMTMNRRKRDVCKIT